MRITRQASTIQIIIDQKQLQNVEYFKYLGSMMTYDAKCTLEIQDCHGKKGIQQEEDLFHQQSGLKFKEETSKVQHLEHSFLWF